MINAVRDLRAGGMLCTMDILGEEVTTKDKALWKESPEAANYLFLTAIALLVLIVARAEKMIGQNAYHCRFSLSR